MKKIFTILAIITFSLNVAFALENGMSVRAMLVDNIKQVKEAPADINTEEDLANSLPYIK